MLLASLFRRKPVFYRIFINVLKTDGSVLDVRTNVFGLNIQQAIKTL